MAAAQSALLDNVENNTVQPEVSNTLRVAILQSAGTDVQGWLLQNP